MDRFVRRILGSPGSGGGRSRSRSPLQARSRSPSQPRDGDSPTKSYYLSPSPSSGDSLILQTPQVQRPHVRPSMQSVPPRRARHPELRRSPGSVQPRPPSQHNHPHPHRHTVRTFTPQVPRAQHRRRAPRSTRSEGKSLRPQEGRKPGVSSDVMKALGQAVQHALQHSRTHHTNPHSRTHHTTHPAKPHSKHKKPRSVNPARHDGGRPRAKTTRRPAHTAPMPRSAVRTQSESVPGTSSGTSSSQRPRPHGECESSPASGSAAGLPVAGGASQAGSVPGYRGTRAMRLRHQHIRTVHSPPPTVSEVVVGGKPLGGRSGRARKRSPSPQRLGAAPHRRCTSRRNTLMRTLTSASAREEARPLQPELRDSPDFHDATYQESCSVPESASVGRGSPAPGSPAEQTVSPGTSVEVVQRVRREACTMLSSLVPEFGVSAAASTTVLWEWAPWTGGTRNSTRSSGGGDGGDGADDGGGGDLPQNSSASDSAAAQMLGLPNHLQATLHTQTEPALVVVGEPGGLDVTEVRALRTHSCQGVRVVAVKPDSAFARGLIRAGDVVLSVGAASEDTPVWCATMTAFEQALLGRTVGDVVRLGVLRRMPDSHFRGNQPVPVVRHPPADMLFPNSADPVRAMRQLFAQTQDGGSAGGGLQGQGGASVSGSGAVGSSGGVGSPSWGPRPLGEQLPAGHTPLSCAQGPHFFYFEAEVEVRTSAYPAADVAVLRRLADVTRPLSPAVVRAYVSVAHALEPYLVEAREMVGRLDRGDFMTFLSQPDPMGPQGRPGLRSRALRLVTDVLMTLADRDTDWPSFVGFSANFSQFVEDLVNFDPTDVCVRTQRLIREMVTATTTGDQATTQRAPERKEDAGQQTQGQGQGQDDDFADLFAHLRHPLSPSLPSPPLRANKHDACISSYQERKAHAEGKGTRSNPSKAPAVAHRFVCDPELFASGSDDDGQQQSDERRIDRVAYLLCNWVLLITHYQYRYLHWYREIPQRAWEYTAPPHKAPSPHQSPQGSAPSPPPPAQQVPSSVQSSQLLSQFLMTSPPDSSPTRTLQQEADRMRRDAFGSAAARRLNHGSVVSQQQRARLLAASPGSPPPPTLHSRPAPRASPHYLTPTRAAALKQRGKFATPAPAVDPLDVAVRDRGKDKSGVLRDRSTDRILGVAVESYRPASFPSPTAGPPRSTGVRVAVPRSDRAGGGAQRSGDHGECPSESCAHHWNVAQVGYWLLTVSLELAGYVPMFSKAGVDGAVLMRMRPSLRVSGQLVCLNRTGSNAELRLNLTESHAALVCQAISLLVEQCPLQLD